MAQGKWVILQFETPEDLSSCLGIIQAERPSVRCQARDEEKILVLVEDVQWLEGRLQEELIPFVETRNPQE